jgi:hypothetical protein
MDLIIVGRMEPLKWAADEVCRHVTIIFIQSITLCGEHMSWTELISRVM